MTLKEKANLLYEHWSSPYTPDNYCAEDMKRVFEFGGEWVLDEVIKWLNKGGYFVNNTETKEDLIKAIKGE